MTTIVQIGRDKYNLQLDMELWCVDNIGKNPPYKNWVYSKPISWEGLGDWCMSSMFGITFFYFKEESHARLFEQAWS